MDHENGDKQRPVKRRHVQGMLDETDPLRILKLESFFVVIFAMSFNQKERMVLLQYL